MWVIVGFGGGAPLWPVPSLFPPSMGLDWGRQERIQSLQITFQPPSPIQTPFLLPIALGMGVGRTSSQALHHLPSVKA